MRFIKNEEANFYLNKVGMEIGAWNQICNNLGRQYDKSHWINYQVPKDARELHNFSQHIAAWLPNGYWKIFQIDNSTSLGDDELYLIKRLLFGPNDSSKFIFDETLLFEFGEDNNSDEEMLLSSLIFLFMLFDCHGQLVSSNCLDGKHLSIQDGFVYFISYDNKDISDANDLLQRFKNNPYRSIHHE